MSVLLAAIALNAMPVAALAASGRKLYDRGVEAFGKRDYEAAAKLFGDAYATEPEPAYLFSEASAYRRLGKAEMSAVRYEEYLAVVPVGERPDKRAKAAGYAAEMRHAAGLELEATGDCRAAMAHFQKAVHLEPGHGAAWLSLGECAESLGERTLAGSAYEKALVALAPDDALRKKTIERLEALRAAPRTEDSTFVPPSATERRKRGKTLGIVLGVAGGVLLAGTVTTVVLLANRSGRSPLEFPGTGLGVMGWKTGH